MFDATHDPEAMEMDRELKAATRRDRKARKEDGEDEDMVRRTIHGKGKKEVESEFESAMIKWIHTIREGFAPSVIRRTVFSVDDEGNRISGLPPFVEHPLVLSLYDHELGNLDRIAEELLSDTGGVKQAARFASGKVS